jgi:hypothetical protein
VTIRKSWPIPCFKTRASRWRRLPKTEARN